MVEEQVISRGIRDHKVVAAMRKVPRHLFVEEALQNQAYSDRPLSIGEKQTISQPYMVAVMTEWLNVRDRQKVLEIGTGSGYQAAILAMLNPHGKIYTIEMQPELAESAKENLKDYKNVNVFSGDGSLGLPEYAPYDRIIATAGCPSVPKPWIKQLKDKGKILAPIGGMYEQRLVMVEKKKKDIIERDLNFPCVFVPLRGLYGWR